jgi:hypothetical protein
MQRFWKSWSRAPSTSGARCCAQPSRVLTAGIKPTDRAEVVTVEQFCALARIV